jgi:hypothetical protein
MSVARLKRGRKGNFDKTGGKVGEKKKLQIKHDEK